MMNVVITLITGSAGALLVNIISTFPRKPTFKQQTEDLKKEYEAIKRRHDRFVEEILPLIQPGELTAPHDEGVKKTTILLKKHSFEIMAVEDEIACGGVYLVNLQRRINVLAEDLRELTMNTMERTTIAIDLLSKLADSRERLVSYGEDGEAVKIDVTFRKQEQIPGTSPPDV